MSDCCFPRPLDILTSQANADAYIDGTRSSRKMGILIPQQQKMGILIPSLYISVYHMSPNTTIWTCTNFWWICAPAMRICNTSDDLSWIKRPTSNIRGTNSHSVNVSRLVLQLSLRSLLKSGVRSRMRMQLEQGQQAMLQLHLSDQQFSCLLRWALY